MTHAFRISPNVRYRVIDGEAVVVRQREGDVVVLNNVAARVLQLVDEGLSQPEIGNRLAGEYEAPIEVVRADVERFIAELESLGVVERLAAIGDGP